MRAIDIGLITVVYLIVAIFLGKIVDRNRAIKSLYRAARSERQRTILIYEPIPYGDVTMIPRSALISDMPKEWV